MSAVFSFTFTLNPAMRDVPFLTTQILAAGSLHPLISENRRNMRLLRHTPKRYATYAERNALTLANVKLQIITSICMNGPLLSSISDPHSYHAIASVTIQSSYPVLTNLSNPPQLRATIFPCYSVRQCEQESGKKDKEIHFYSNSTPEDF